MPAGVPWKRFGRDLKTEVSDDNVASGAAALAYYLMLSVFPAAIALLSLLPYLPIPNLEQAIMDALREALPGEAAGVVTGVVEDAMGDRRGGLLSFGLLAALWAASNGLYAVMQQLNITYDVKEERPFWKARGLAILLTFLFGALIVGAFALVVGGGALQSWLAGMFGWSGLLRGVFVVFRWVVIAALLLLGFALVYYLGPNVEQRFRFVSPGSLIGAALLVAASLAFRLYISNFGNFGATYGSLGAVIILLLWLYMAGWVILLGAEVNALVEHYRPDGKPKGRKSMRDASDARQRPPEEASRKTPPPPGPEDRGPHALH